MTAQTNYLKIDKTFTKEKEVNIKELQNKIYELSNKLYELENNNNNQIDNNVEDKKYKKNRYDMIFKLNKNTYQKPWETTLIKYNILYDKQLKNYF